MAVQAKIKMWPATHQSDSGFSAPAKVSATFVGGAPVKLSSGNLVAVATANKSSTTHLHKSSVQNIIGIAQGFGRASVYKIINDYYPDHMGSVGGSVATIGAAGGFTLPE